MPHTRTLTVSRVAAAAVAATTVLAGPGVTSAASAASYRSAITFGHGPHRFAGGNWGGYVSTGGFTTARASWVMPAVTCTSSSDLFAPWVGLDGVGSSTVEQIGVAVDCANGSPDYRPWIEMYPAAPDYFVEDVRAGDRVTGEVSYAGSGVYHLTLGDSTTGWSRTFTRSASAKNLTAEAIIESPSNSYPKMAGVRFFDVTFDGRDLAATSPSALSAEDRGAEDHGAEDHDPAGRGADDRGAGVWQPSDISADQRGFSLTRS